MFSKYQIICLFAFLLKTFDCLNIPQNDKQVKIIGGANANAGQFPYSAAIYVQTESSTFFCGGALLNNQWVITAGYCANGALQFTILIGSNSLSSNDPNRVTVATSRYFVHPDYNSQTLENNIALIQLRMPIDYSDYIQPIEMSTSDVPVHDHLTAIGWGQTSDDKDELSDHLQYVSLITLTNEECANVYGYQVSADMICATGDYSEGTCLGDTGGPLIQHIYNPQGVRLAGVASFISGDGCDKPHPSGYTRIYIYSDWIQSTLDNTTMYF